MPTVQVDLAERSYEVIVEPGILARTGERLAAAGFKGKAAVISDETVAALHAGALLTSLEAAGFTATLHTLPAGEASKSLGEAEDLCRSMIRAGHDRKSFVVALGGGVTGDLAGFVAAIFYRGIPFAQIPTTIVSQVDSSVGGKTGVNLPAGKNLAGAFHQPRAVVADVDVLATLPQREYRAGLAEIVKGAAIGDPDFFVWLETHADALARRDPDILIEAIARKCRYKAGVVARDETEQGERALLNLGHTFGHALETAGNYSEILHGEGVAIGMVLAARLSERLGMAPAADTQRLVQLLERLGLPTAPSRQHAASRLLDLMRLDKKNTAESRREEARRTAPMTKPRVRL